MMQQFLSGIALQLLCLTMCCVLSGLAAQLVLCTAAALWAQ
jgi:hypothetical protein